MKKQKKALGIFTFLCGFPALLAVVALLSIPDGTDAAELLGGFSLNAFTIGIIFTVIIRGFGGIIGGIMLYKGMAKGYYICAVVWGYFLLTSLYGLVSTLMSDVIDDWGIFADIAIVKLLVVIVFSSAFLVSLYKSYNSKSGGEKDNKSKHSDSVNAAGV